MVEFQIVDERTAQTNEEGLRPCSIQRETDATRQRASSVWHYQINYRLRYATNPSKQDTTTIVHRHLNNQPFLSLLVRTTTTAIGCVYKCVIHTPTATRIVGVGGVVTFRVFVRGPVSLFWI